MIVGWVAMSRRPQAEAKEGCLGSQRWLAGHFLPFREELRQTIGNNEKDIAKEELIDLKRREGQVTIGFFIL